MQMVNTFSLSVSAATFPNPTYKINEFLLQPSKASKRERGWVEGAFVMNHLKEIKNSLSDLWNAKMKGKRKTRAIGMNKWVRRVYLHHERISTFTFSFHWTKKQTNSPKSCRSSWSRAQWRTLFVSADHSPAPASAWCRSTKYKSTGFVLRLPASTTNCMRPVGMFLSLLVKLIFSAKERRRKNLSHPIVGICSTNIIPDARQPMSHQHVEA